MANESEQEKRETLANIVAEMRKRKEMLITAILSTALCNPTDRMEAQADILDEFADRIDAAWRRDEERAIEHATRHAEAVARDNCRDCVHNPNGKNYEGVGNAAAMREACAKMRDLLMLRGDGKEYCILSWDEFNDSQKMLRAALSAPARNCDLYATYAEAAEAHKEYATAYIMRASNKFDSPMEFDEWLFAPAAERKGECK